jgi:hypothetical protein
VGARGFFVGAAILVLALVLSGGLSFAHEPQDQEEDNAAEPRPVASDEAADDYDFGADFVPSLENRKLGDPYEEDGERVIYGRALPFLAQQAYDLGFNLPHPFGVAFIGYWQEQDLILEDLYISINDGPVQSIDFVDFGTPSVENTTGQLKFDAWIFPFMNVFATVGAFDGDGDIPIMIEGKDLMEFLGFGDLCTGGILEPAICKRRLSAIAEPEYEGTNVSVGVNLAMGWKQFFVTLPVTYAVSDVDIIDDEVDAWIVGPRIGINGSVGELGSLAAYVGANYLSTDVDVAGRVAFDTSGAGPVLEDITTVDYVIRQRNKDEWNYVVGFNWDIRRNWSVQTEAGFGGSRTHFIGSATRRF